MQPPWHPIASEMNPVAAETLDDANMNMPLPPELGAEGSARVDNDDHAPAEGELHATTSYDMSSWSSRVDEPLAAMMQSEIITVRPSLQGVELIFNLSLTQDAELQDLMRYIDQFEEHGNKGSTSTDSPHFMVNENPKLPSEIPSIDSEHRSYLCSWQPPDSTIQCHQIAHGRLAFLHHLGTLHQASGSEDATIICRLLDSKTGSTCDKAVKRGNLPRHVDTLYPLRYHCHYCLAEKSFSRQDSWRKHIRNKHPQSLPTS
ncbi:hypothetical protein JVU11DRAFT_7606 [Chiua virens]|nr:hypothetical protein JVU11DRAFT_7606 [Chiua virens]